MSEINDTEEKISDGLNPGDTLTQPLLEKKPKKSIFVFGIIALLLVDIIWVASSEATRYLFKDFKFDKPYMSTYIKTSMFSIYLFGFIIYSPWRRQCIRCACDDYPGQYQLVGETDTEDTDDGEYSLRTSLSESIYVPAKIPSTSEIESCTESEKETKPPVPNTRVKFNNLMEVKHLEDCDDSQIARMNYGAAAHAKFVNKIKKGFLTLPQVVRISFIFTVVFFLGNVSYQEAINVAEVAVVNILSSTSGIFTLILASMFPSGPTDKFTLSKLMAVFISFVGIAMVTLGAEDSSAEKLITSDRVLTGAMWSLLGAFCYALYLVLLKKSVGSEGNLSVPMFFGFVGLFSFSLLWPGMVALHYLGIEIFQLPGKYPAIIMIINGLVGTVISELLWVWGCIATSSLIGTMSLSLTFPLSIFIDIIFRKAQYSWMFYVGVVPVFLSFIVVAYLSHYNPEKDPLLNCLKKCFCCFSCKRKKPEFEKEQEIPLTRFEDDAEP